MHTTEIPNAENISICNYPIFAPQNGIMQPSYEIEKNNFDDQGAINNFQVHSTIPLCATSLSNWNDYYKVAPHPSQIPQLFQVLPSTVHNQSKFCQNIDTTRAIGTNSISLKPQNYLKRQKYYKGNFIQERAKSSRRFRKANRNISFSNQVKVRKYYLKDLHEADKNNLWYTDREMEDFKKNAKEVIYRARENRCEKDEHRGLESRISEKRSMFRSLTIKTVLKYQEHLLEKSRKIQQENDSEEKKMTHGEYTSSDQYQLGTDDQLKLAYVSRRCTEWARNVAFNAAKSDYEEACGSNTVRSP